MRFNIENIVKDRLYVARDVNQVAKDSNLLCIKSSYKIVDKYDAISNALAYIIVPEYSVLEKKVFAYIIYKHLTNTVIYKKDVIRYFANKFNVCDRTIANVITRTKIDGYIVEGADNSITISSKLANINSDITHIVINVNDED